LSPLVIQGDRRTRRHSRRPAPSVITHAEVRRPPPPTTAAPGNGTRSCGWSAAAAVVDSDAAVAATVDLNVRWPLPSAAGHAGVERPPPPNSAAPDDDIRGLSSSSTEIGDDTGSAWRPPYATLKHGGRRPAPRHAMWWGGGRPQLAPHMSSVLVDGQRRPPHLTFCAAAAAERRQARQG